MDINFHIQGVLANLLQKQQDAAAQAGSLRMLADNMQAWPHTGGEDERALIEAHTRLALMAAEDFERASKSAESLAEAVTNLRSKLYAPQKNKPE